MTAIFIGRQCARRLLQNLGDARHLRGRVAQRPRSCRAVRAEALAAAAILEQRRQFGGERRRIAGRHEHAARLVDDLLRAAERRRHDRKPRGHRFDQAEAERVGLDVRLAVDVGAGEQARDVGPIAEKFDAIGNTQRGCLRAERFHVLRLVRPLRSTCETAGPSRGRAIARAPSEARRVLSAAPSC